MISAGRVVGLEAAARATQRAIGTLENAVVMMGLPHPRGNSKGVAATRRFLRNSLPDRNLAPRLHRAVKTSLRVTDGRVMKNIVSASEAAAGAIVRRTPRFTPRGYSP